MKTNAQLLDEITAAMADAWLAACDRRVIGTTAELKHLVVDVQQRLAQIGHKGRCGAQVALPDTESRNDLRLRIKSDEGSLVADA